jgi:hypothetical protein
MAPRAKEKRSRLPTGEPEKPPTGSCPPRSATKERLLISCLSAIAAVRVFVFSAAFPFFNNVDEQAHFDLVIKYSHGCLPRSLDGIAAESTHYLTTYSSPEYYRKPADYPGGTFPPPTWRQPDTEDKTRVLSQVREELQSHKNYESPDPPLYYVLAGAWLHVGRMIGLNAGWLLYWLRFLNVGLAALTVLVGARLARLIFPDCDLPAIGVPLLLALWPQTTLYSIQPDALSPLCFGLAFLALVRMLRSESLRLADGVALGLALAATVLTKLSNLPLMLVAGVGVIANEWPLRRRAVPRRQVLALAAFFLCATIPVAAWLVWNYSAFGDFTATTAKMRLLTWTKRPIADYGSHPIFTLDGIKEFWSELLTSFWRGEFVWFGRRLASPITDSFYWISSTAALVVTTVYLLPRFQHADRVEKKALMLALSSFVSVVGFLALLSIAIDFGSCTYPSRAHPYFSSGRLLNAAAMPFFVLYAYALDLVTRRTKRAWVSWATLAGVAAFITLSQTIVNWPAFDSQYNFFHLRQ